MRGGIFAIFTPSDGESPGQVSFGADGSYAEPLAKPVAHEVAAAHAEKAARALLDLERRGEVVIARSIEDVDAARDSDTPPVAVMHLEGAEAIAADPMDLDAWYERGLRSLGPVWSRPNDFAHGVPFVFPSSPDTGPGLTDKGKSLARACTELGVLIDLSHLNEAGFWDVAALSNAPLVATHSNAHALCACSRNLTDKQLDAIRASGGVVGLNLAVSFLRADGRNDADTPVETLVAHVDHLVERLGIDGVALGTDFDGCTVPACIKDAAGLPVLIEALRARGYDEPALRKFAHENWVAVLERTWGG